MNTATIIINKSLDTLRDSASLSPKSIAIYPKKRATAKITEKLTILISLLSAIRFKAVKISLIFHFNVHGCIKT